MTYAVPAEISTVFATKDQLMDSVLHYDGTPDCIGKLELGKMKTVHILGTYWER